MRGLALLLAAWLALGGAARAVEPEERLADSRLEARALAITHELRCVVCQSQTVDDSSAPVAKALRLLVRERLQAGDTDAQARAAVVDRYGEFVLLNPPLEPATVLLWLGPFAVLAAGGTAAALWIRRQARTPLDPPALDAEERRAVDEAAAP